MSWVMSCAAATQRGGDHEDDQRDLEQALAPVSVAELAPQRRCCGSGHDVRGDYPRDVAEAAQVAAIIGSPVARIVWSRTAGSIASTTAANGNVTSLPSREGDDLWLLDVCI